MLSVSLIQLTAFELPTPPRIVTLKHIPLGFGIQNYSCTDVGAIPVPIGALAVLYDATNLYPGQDRSSLTPGEWVSLPSDVLNTGKVPLNRNENGGASLTNPFPKKQSLKSIPYLGHHFFNGAGTPIFDLDKANQLLMAKKINAVKAPASAPAGPEGSGAVDWLYLGDAGGSQGVSIAYRVLTAGGVSHGCKAKGTDSTS
ncbi:unnamed protein product [Fusarium graminearum]|uniref:Uncharacterized protein n=1 Tax=Gibberella zeae TaxID=5518 RepID=A0A4E9EIY5_GIBZA|nr:unnamed protein product [Fusarium graminearum]